MSTSYSDHGKFLTLAALGLFGVGSYALTKHLISKKRDQREDQKQAKKVRKAVRKQDSEKFKHEIEEQIKEKLQDMNSEFLDKHARRLKELVA